MEDKLNIAEILKDAPKGTKLWSPVCGECTFQYIDNIAIDFPIVCLAVDKYGQKTQVLFTKYGWVYSTFAYGECVLFPSKENREWSTFKVPKKPKEFKPFEKVLVKVFREGRLIWMATFYSHYDKAACQHLLVGGFTRDDDDIIPYEGNEDMVGKKAE